MYDLSQLAAQASQFFTELFSEVSHLTDSLLISGVLSHVWALLKAIIHFIIIALEVMVKILRFIIQ